MEVAEEIKTHILFDNLFSKNCAVYEIMWKNTIVPGSPQMTMWHTHTHCMLDT
jgi:hypothetical protein